MKKLLLLLFFVTTIALAGIPLSTNFTVNTALPIDDRMSVADTTARDAIPALKRWEGMLVYSIADGKHYTLIGGITNGDWSELSGGGGNLTEWVTATPYVVGNTVTETYKIYVCTTDHTSGTFATDYNTNGYWIELSAGVDLSGDQTISGNKTFSDVTLLGYPASEGTGVNVNGTTNESSLIISDVASTNEAQTILHRHSTTLEPLILSARSNSNADTEGDVVANQNMFSLLGTGWKTDNYKIFGSMNIAASTLGTLSSTSAPGKVLINTTPNGATVPTAHLTLDSDKSSVFEGSVTAKGDLSGHNFSKNNLLVNSNFEYSTVSTGWTITNATASASAAPVEGAYALSLSLTGALNVYQDSATNAARLNGLQGLASIKIKTSDVDGLKVCSRNDGTTSTMLCITVPKDGVWKEINIPFILSGTANGIAITSTGTSGTVEVDNAFVGTSAPFQNVNGAKLVGTLKYAGTASCEWILVSPTSTYTNFSVDTDCPTPSTTGSIQAPATKIPAFVLPSGSPAGTYRIFANGMFYNNSSNYNLLRMSDGTNSTNGGVNYLLNSGGFGISGEITYSTSLTSNTTIQIQAKTDTGNSNITATTLTDGLSFSVYYFPPESKIYSQASQDYDWTSYTPTFTGFGTATNIDCYHKRKGSDLYVKCKWTAGTSTATEARVSLPSGLTSTAFASIRTAGVVTYGTVQNGLSLYALIEPSQTYFTFGLNSAAVGSLNKRNGVDFAPSGQVLSFDSGPIPITGWQDYGVIVGSFAETPKTPGASNTDFFSVSYGTTNLTTDCSASPCFIDQIGSNVTSITWTSAGNMTMNLPKTYAQLKCSIVAVSSATTNIAPTSRMACENCNSLTITTVNGSGTNTNTRGTILCQGKN